MNHTIIVILICIALAAWSLHREYRRELKRYLLLRILASIIAISSLACLILPITYFGDYKSADNRKILLTAGFAGDSIRATANDSIYTLDKTVHQQYPKAKLVSNINEITAPLHVFGYGLTKDELDELGVKQITFHPSHIPDGIIAASWTDQIKAGELLSVQLKYKNSTQRKYKLLLNGLNTTLDSATVPANNETDITLQTKPKSTGKMVYSLVVLAGKDTLQQEQIPVSINIIKPLNVLILSASPDFETKFLKNWLGENGYSVASRTIITKGKFSQEYINIEPANLTNLSAQLLNKFDVLIGDQSLLQSLNATESNAVQQAVTEKGMGVIIRADSTGKSNSWLQRNFTINPILGKQPAATAIYLQEKSKTAKLTTDPLYINNYNDIQTLATDEQKHVVIAAALTGAGKLIFTTLNNTHNWLLTGDRNDYYALWSLLLSNAARKVPVASNWTVQSAIPFVNQPVKLGLEKSEEVSNIEINHSIAYPATDATSLFRKNTTYWPDKIGWQEAIANNSSYKWYTWSEKSWKSLNGAYKLSVTNKFIRQNRSNGRFTAQISYKNSIAVPKIYFFILFLMACSFLWAERKFFNT